LTPRRLTHGLRPHFDRPRSEPRGGSNRIGMVPNRWSEMSMACRTSNANKLLPWWRTVRGKSDPVTQLISGRRAFARRPRRRAPAGNASRGRRPRS
jgi:hypothetical protein